MAQITITIPDAVLPRVIDALCVRGGYGIGADGSPPPPSRPAFAKQQIIQYIKAVVANYEGGLAAKTAETTARTSADTDIALS